MEGWYGGIGVAECYAREKQNQPRGTSCLNKFVDGVSAFPEIGETGVLRCCFFADLDGYGEWVWPDVVEIEEQEAMFGTLSAESEAFQEGLETVLRGGGDAGWSARAFIEG